VHVASSHYGLGGPTMADHPGRENRIPWNPIHDTLPYWSMDDDSAFIALNRVPPDGARQSCTLSIQTPDGPL